MVSACQAVVRPRGSGYHNSQKNLSLGARARLLLAPLVVAARAVTEARAARVHVLSLRGRPPPIKGRARLILRGVPGDVCLYVP